MALGEEGAKHTKFGGEVREEVGDMCTITGLRTVGEGTVTSKNYKCPVHMCPS